MNQVLLHLYRDPTTRLRLLFSRQWLGSGQKLPEQCPLRDLPFDAFSWPENVTERCWKLLGVPHMDAFIPAETDWLYCPMDTFFPTRRRIRKAITLHDIHPFEPTLPWRSRRQHAWQRWKWGRWVRRAFDDCAIVFTVSEFSKRRMIDLLNAPAEKIVVVGNGVEEAFFACGATDAREFPRPIDRPYLAMVGGLREAKGGKHLLAVAKELATRGSDIQIVVAGPNDPHLAKQAAHYSNVHLLGMVSDAALPGLLKHALAMVFLSLYEGFGIPPLEAMAVGTPAIVANRASLPEVVGDAGFIVEPDESRLIADTCLQLQMSIGFRDEVATRGRERAAHYSWARCGRSVLQALADYRS